ncbi:MAG: LysM peptidoglycan-binding domain-containing protein, partial [Nitrospinota bacterium]|nr:LysM peptidoglycan-binding domain-containing protein [Nitrospinota bacterium]
LYAGKVYEVRNGDTLGEIARNLGTTIEALAKVNGLRNPSRLAVGQRLVLPEKSLKPARVRTGKLSAGAKIERPAAGVDGAHVVRSGESIWDISRRYGVSVANLLTWNRLSKDALIMPGDKIALSSN